jgi:hypothetical protein
MRALSLVALAGALLLASAASSSAPFTFYLSPTGDDSNSGMTPSSPWKTVQRAQAGIVAVRRGNGGTLPSDVLVSLASGTYFLADSGQGPLNISAADGGDAGGSSVTYAGPPSGDPAILSAGTVVSGWTALAGSPGVFTAPLPSSPSFPSSAFFVRQLFAIAPGNPNPPRPVDPSRASANATAIPTSPSRRLLVSTDTLVANFTNQSIVVFQPGQITSPLAAYAQAEVRVYHNWISATNKIAAIDVATNTITLVGQGGDPFFNAGGKRFAFQNVADPAALFPGSFFYDSATKTITYRALPGEDPTDAAALTMVVECLPVAVLLSGTPAAPVSNVVLANLTVAHTAAVLEQACMSGGCGDQSAADLDYAAVMTTYASGCAFTGLEVVDVGQYAFWLRVGSTDITVSQCWLHSLGAGGVRAGETSYENDSVGVVTGLLITDNAVEDSGYTVEAGAGVLVHQATSSAVEHNHIHNLKYTGVSTGWTWGYGPTVNTALRVAKNLIHDIGLGILSDMGCIYNLGVSVGTNITGNVCHDVTSFGYGGWGLYTDEGSSWVNISSNIVHSTKASGIHQHYGENNTFVNNVVAFPVYSAGDDGSGEELDATGVRSSQHGPGGGAGVNSSFAFFRNIIILSNPNTTNAYFTTITTAMSNMTVDDNLYWHTAYPDPASTLRFAPTQDPTTWAQWQQNSKDGHGLIADPLFADAEAFNFTLLPNSPALALGFVPIDTSDVGPRPMRAARRMEGFEAPRPL